MINPKPITERLSHLDGLRGIAALTVLVQHTLETTPLLTTSNTIGNVLTENLNLGRFGVAVFFLISGFLIPSTLKPQPGTLKRFAISRFARLYPLYWVSLLTGLLVALGIGLYAHPVPVQSLKETLISLTMLQRGLGIKDVYGPYWTLFVELIFYGACVSLFLLGLLFKPRTISTLFIGACIASAILSAITIYTAHLGGIHKGLLQLSTFSNHLLLMFTGYLFRLHQDKQLSPTRLAGSVAAVIGCFAAYGISRHLNGNFEDILGPRTIFISTISGGLLFWFTIRHRLFAHGLFVYLGAISYGLYLFHAQAIHIGLTLNHGNPQNLLQSLSLLAFTLLLAGLVAHIAHYLIEQPAINAGHAWRKRLR